MPREVHLVGLRQSLASCDLRNLSVRVRYDNSPNLHGHPRGANRPSLEKDVRRLRLAAGLLRKEEADAEAAWLERCKAEAATFHPYIHADG